MKLVNDSIRHAVLEDFINKKCYQKRNGYVFNVAPAWRVLYPVNIAVYSNVYEIVNGYDT